MTAPSRLPEAHAAAQRHLRHRRGRLRVLVDGRLVARTAASRTYNNWVCRCVPCAEVARVNKRERSERAQRAAAARIRAAAGRRG